MQKSPRKDALEAGRPFYEGNQCSECQGTTKHAITRKCVKCYPNRDGSNKINIRGPGRDSPKQREDFSNVADYALSLMVKGGVK